MLSEQCVAALLHGRQRAAAITVHSALRHWVVGAFNQCRKWSPEPLYFILLWIKAFTLSKMHCNVTKGEMVEERGFKLQTTQPCVWCELYRSALIFVWFDLTCQNVVFVKGSTCSPKDLQIQVQSGSDFFLFFSFRIWPLYVTLIMKWDTQDVREINTFCYNPRVLASIIQELERFTHTCTHTHFVLLIYNGPKLQTSTSMIRKTTGYS